MSEERDDGEQRRRADEDANGDDESEHAGHLEPLEAAGLGVARAGATGHLPNTFPAPIASSRAVRLARAIAVSSANVWQSFKPWSA